MNARVWLSWIAVSALCAACSATGSRPVPIDARAARAVAIFRADGAPASWDEMVAMAANADAVLLGENHGHPLGLASASALFDDVLARAPRASLSMEFFERDEQARLDDYLTGVSDLATFQQRTDRREGNFPSGHRAMVDAAKSQHRPVHAANAPRAYVRVARLDGYERLESLTAEQRRLFTVPAHLAAGRYRDDFDRVMMPADAELFPPDDVHRRLDAAFRAQQLWDWTMADSIATAVEQGERPVVHVVGRFHVDFHGGTVQALERESMGTRIVVVSFVDEESDALRDEDRGRADFVVYVGASAE